MVAAAKLGGHVATVSWFSKGTLISSCFVDHHAIDFPEAWPRFFDALQLRSYRSAADDALAKGRPGSRESIGTSVGGGAVNQIHLHAGAVLCMVRCRPAIHGSLTPRDDDLDQHGVRRRMIHASRQYADIEIGWRRERSVAHSVGAVQ